MSNHILEYFEPVAEEDYDDDIERYVVKKGYVVEYYPFDKFYIRGIEIDTNDMVTFITHEFNGLKPFHANDDIQDITVYKEIKH